MINQNQNQIQTKDPTRNRLCLGGKRKSYASVRPVFGGNKESIADFYFILWKKKKNWSILLTQNLLLSISEEKK